MSTDTPAEEPSDADATQRRRTIRLLLIGLVVGTIIGYVAVSLHNGDLAWLKQLAIAA